MKETFNREHEFPYGEDGPRWSYYPCFPVENHSYVAPIELTFKTKESTEWMRRNWWYSFLISFFYIALIFALQKYMRSRKPYAMEQALFWWNLGLATFSAMGASRMIPELIWAVNSNSFTYSICTASYAQRVTGFWTEIFAMSKVFELLDTIFIVLRKRPLIFLHYYHHMTVLVYTWSLYKDHTASGRWFITMNYTIHAFMYGYYAIRALRFRTPKMMAMLVTIMQIMQMVMGVFIGVYTFTWGLKQQGFICQHTWPNLLASFFIYFTYFLLFCHFFYKRYVKRANSPMEISNGLARQKTAGASVIISNAKGSDSTST